MTPAARPPRTDLRSAAEVRRQMLAHLAELQRLVEAGEVDAIVATSRTAGRRSWIARAVGRLDDAAIAGIADRFARTLGGHDPAVVGNIAMRLDEESP